MNDKYGITSSTNLITNLITVQNPYRFFSPWFKQGSLEPAKTFVKILESDKKSL